MPSRFFKVWLRRFFAPASRLDSQGQRSRPRPALLCLEVLEQRTVMAAALNQAFIASAYQALLGRPVDGTGLNYWQQQLDSGTNRTAVVAGILASSEYENRELTQLYQTYLGRNPDAGGAAYWRQQLNAGASWEQVEADIAGSPEHYNYVGEYVYSDVANLFQNTLHRQLDTNGSQYFQNLSTSGASLTTLASQVLNSPEAQTRIVTSDYQTVLGRAADAAGLSYWTGQLAAGASRTNVLAGFLGSDEFASQLAAYLPSTSNDPNAAASAFLNSQHRFSAAPQAPQLQLQVPSDTAIDPTIHVLVTRGTGGMPQSVVVDVDTNNDGVFSGNELARYTAPVVNGVATVTLTNFPEANHLVRARAVDPSGVQGVSQAFVIRRIDSDPINPAVPAQLAAQAQADAAVRAIDQQNAGTVSALAADSVPSSTASGVQRDIPQNGSGSVSPTLPGSNVPVSNPTLLGNNTFTQSTPNFSVATANTVPLVSNQTLTIIGNVSAASQSDYYTFTLTTPSGVFFELNSRDIGLSTTFDSALTLYGSNGTTIIDTNDNGYNFDTGWPLQASYASSSTADSDMYEDLQPGTYYIAVMGMNNTTGPYQLNITPDTNYSNTPPQLSSLPSAPATLYLDFLGYSSSGGDDWNDTSGAPGAGSPYTLAPYRFPGNTGPLTPGEQLAMTNIWEVVSEDYSPFNINVTTVDPGPAAFVDGKAMRVVFGGDQSDLPNDQLGTGTIGVGIENSFATGGTQDQLCFVFGDDPFFGNGAPGGTDSSSQIEYVAEYLGNTASHEIGHTMGLYHYAILPNNLPIMEFAGPDTRATWWMGMTRDESSTGGNPSIFQDDMAVISNTINGFGYRPDAFGQSIATATALTPSSGTTFNASGVIDNPTAQPDFFSFTTGSTGTVTVNVYVNYYSNDLNSQVSLYDSSGTLIANNNNPASYDSQLSQTLNAGTYYVAVSSKGNPGEAGQYNLAIAVPATVVPPPPPVPPSPPGPPPPPPPGTVVTLSTSDIYDPNQTSDQASNLGTPVKGLIYSLENLTIQNTPQGLPDYDWFKFTMPTSGNFYVTTDTTAGGPLETHLFTLVGVTLTEVTNSTSNGTLLMGVTAGQTAFIEVKGENTGPSTKTTGTYNLDVSLN